MLNLKYKIPFASFVGACLLSGCVMERLADVGTGPKISQIQNPTMLEGYTPISMPMPTATSEERHVNSLWQTGSKAFFKDQRAVKIGDIVTVVVALKHKESTSFTPSIDKKSSMNSTVGNLLGLQHPIENLFPKKFKKDEEESKSWLQTSSNPKHSGSGKYDLEDKLDFSVAATVLQILPNGNMVVQGRTEIKLVNEVREIELKGIIRRSDIKSDNSIGHDKVAELRIVYGGRGDITDVGNRPWGTQILDEVMPF